MTGYRTFSLALVASAFLLTATVSATPTDDERSLALPAPAAEMSEAQWSSFNHSLVTALESESEFMQQAAMRYAIQYADNVNIRSVMTDVMAIYRNHEDDNVRRLAVVTLASMKSGFAANYLRLNQTHEKSIPVKRTIRAVLQGIADGSF
jgi:hypothetical protein